MTGDSYGAYPFFRVLIWKPFAKSFIHTASSEKQVFQHRVCIGTCGGYSLSGAAFRETVRLSFQP
ncbi:hypothetical protein C8R32_10867 [Nitrosospira sp. Nsp5]|uniref:Uncharacterized protein n=1 Tax=Nitrosospira multiformis TaxID=1231 RepID=A0ABY0T6J3_9PROT|nr:hypothetical protein C8R32_10867 [Nitrosospira sp. Nsp5]SDQ33772.1 hypothetical protein SAMN05216402_0445 [Nitrosospira multiformis]